jgi:hypothetical protein
MALPRAALLCGGNLWGPTNSGNNLVSKFEEQI